MKCMLAIIINILTASGFAVDISSSLKLASGTELRPQMLPEVREILNSVNLPEDSRHRSSVGIVRLPAPNLEEDEVANEAHVFIAYRKDKELGITNAAFLDIDPLAAPENLSFTLHGGRFLSIVPRTGAGRLVILNLATREQRIVDPAVISPALATVGGSFCLDGDCQELAVASIGVKYLRSFASLNFTAEPYLNGYFYRIERSQKRAQLLWDAANTLSPVNWSLRPGSSKRYRKILGVDAQDFATIHWIQTNYERNVAAFYVERVNTVFIYDIGQSQVVASFGPCPQCDYVPKTMNDVFDRIETAWPASSSEVFVSLRRGKIRTFATARLDQISMTYSLSATAVAPTSGGSVVLHSTENQENALLVVERTTTSTFEPVFRITKLFGNAADSNLADVLQWDSPFWILGPLGQ